MQLVVLIWDNILISYRDFENENTPYEFTNAAVAAFISSWDRLRLYQAMGAVRIERLLYYDTDSIIYILDDMMKYLC